MFEKLNFFPWEKKQKIRRDKKNDFKAFNLPDRNAVELHVDTIAVLVANAMGSLNYSWLIVVGWLGKLKQRKEKKGPTKKIKSKNFKQIDLR